MKRKIFLTVILCAVMLLVTGCGDKFEFKHGSWDMKTYTSEYFGIKAKVESDWDISDDRSLSADNKISDMSDSSIETLFKDKGSFHEMKALKPNGDNINIFVYDTEKLSSYTKENYFTVYMEALDKDYGSRLMHSKITKDSVNFLGKNTDCLRVESTVLGTTVYEFKIPIFDERYTANISLSTTSKYRLNELAAMFSVI